jgi:teichuronic acid exporter
LAFSLSHIPLILRELIARLLLPILSKQDFNEGKIQIFGRLNGILQIFSVVSAILVTYWSDILFQFVFGEKWSDAVPIFIVLYYAALFKLVGGSSATLLFSAMRTRVAFDVSVLNLVVSAPILFLTIKFSGLSGAAAGVLVSIVVVTIIMYETSIKNFCNLGFLYYLSYLSVNITSLYIIFTFWIDNSDGVMVRVLATLVSLAFAVITLPINSVLKRAFPKLLSTNSKV